MSCLCYASTVLQNPTCGFLYQQIDTSHLQIHIETIPPHCVAVALREFCAGWKWGVAFLEFFFLMHRRVLESEALQNFFHQYKFMKP